MEIKSVSVIGGGTMGNGIVHVFALKGYNVNLVELTNELADRALNNITINMQRQVKKEIITETLKEQALQKIRKIVSIENTPKESDLIIEAIYENKKAKLEIFDKLDNIIKSDSIFASNTSSISLTELSSNHRPDRFIGMHFMNPVPLMKLVEIIRGY